VTDWLAYVQNILHPSFVGSVDVVGPRQLPTMPIRHNSTLQLSLNAMMFLTFYTCYSCVDSNRWPLRFSAPLCVQEDELWHSNISKKMSGGARVTYTYPLTVRGGTKFSSVDCARRIK